MDLTDDDIREFIQIWLDEFGEQITADRARHEASLLLELYVLLARPLPSDGQGDDKTEGDTPDP